VTVPLVLEHQEVLLRNRQGAAVASEAEFLVTFNTGDLTKARRFGVDLVTPGAFLRTIDS